MSQVFDYAKIEIEAQQNSNYRAREIIELFASVLIKENALKWFYYTERKALQESVEEIFISYFEEKNYKEIYSGLNQDDIDRLVNERTEWSDWGLRVENLWLAVGFENTVKNRIDKDIDVLTRKKRELIYVDEFGDEISYLWEEELEQYVENKLSSEVWGYVWKNKEAVQEFLFNFKGYDGSFDDFLQGISRCGYKIRDIVEGKMAENEGLCELESELTNGTIVNNIEESDQPNLLVMSGRDFEHYLAFRINNETTFNAKVTRGSGDQGADLIVRGIGLSAVIQTKLYNAKVGNKAIQEAFSARRFYGTGLAFVVTNAGFTKSALELAEKTGVLALNEKTFIEFLQAMGSLN